MDTPGSMKGEMVLHPIGILHTRLKEGEPCPRQGAFAPEEKGVLTVFPPYREGLEGLQTSEYIILLLHLDRSGEWKSKVRPPGRKDLFGLFATRSPHRPNPIGFSVVKLDKLEGDCLYLSGVDSWDGTPVLDIKPYLPEVDNPERRGRKAEEDQSPA